MSGCKKIVIFKKITSAVSKSVSKFVEIQSRLTFSCKSWKNVSQIIDFADIFPGFLCFLHFWGITHPSKFHFMEIRWQNFKNKQILSAPDHQLLLTSKSPLQTPKMLADTWLLGSKSKPRKHRPGYRDRIISHRPMYDIKSLLRDTWKIHRQQKRVQISLPLQRTKRKSKRKPRTFIQSMRGLSTVWARPPH